MIGLAIGLSDFVASSVFKPMVERLRPSHVPELEGVLHIVNGYRGGQFGFMSSHAANSFALATFFALCMRSRSLSTVLFIWATLNAYSRIYLGVHYPGDVICGAALGSFSAYLAYFLLLKIRPTLLSKKAEGHSWAEITVTAFCVFTAFFCFI